MAIFFNFSPTSNHLHPLQVENCDSHSRLVVDEMTMVNSGLKGLINLNFKSLKISQGHVTEMLSNMQISEILETLNLYWLNVGQCHSQWSNIRPPQVQDFVFYVKSNLPKKFCYCSYICIVYNMLVFWF